MILSTIYAFSELYISSNWPKYLDVWQVDKHGSFQDSRCLFVVSTDGSQQDFSYRKCLESFIRGKYPDLVDEFIGKYFRRPRSGGNREPSLPPVPEEKTVDQD